MCSIHLLQGHRIHPHAGGTGNVGGLHRSDNASLETAAARFGAMLFLQRMRTPADRAHVERMFQETWGVPMPDLSRPSVLVTPDALSIGWARLPRAEQGVRSYHASASGIARPTRCHQGLPGASIVHTARCVPV